MVKRIGIGMVGMAALLAGCHRNAPAGQVAATVNGEEVTLQEVNAEIASANLPATVDRKEAQRALLQRVIDRKLIVADAQEKGIDKTAEFLSEKRRTDELLIAQAYAKQKLAAIAVPTESDIQKYITDHPNVFQKREQIVLDQIRFPTPKDIQSLRALEGDHSMDAVAAHLTQMGVKFQRGNAGLDSAQAPAPLIKMIDTVTPGEPFVVPDAGMITVNVVTGRRPIAINPQQAKAGAVTAWRQQKFQDLLGQQITTLRGTAKITYQDGFAPLPPKAGAAKPGAATPPAAAPAGPASDMASSSAPAPTH
jgi:EpsD family peptidyl-prolyl cis-trans isomerase